VKSKVDNIHFAIMNEKLNEIERNSVQQILTILLPFFVTVSFDHWSLVGWYNYFWGHNSLDAD